MQQCSHCGELLESTKTPPRFCSSCGQPLRPLTDAPTQPYTPPTTAPMVTVAEAAAPPDSVGGYRLLRPIGEGGMGSVFEGEEIATGRRVAVKLIRAEYADSPDAVERFRREGQLAGTIAHPRCVFVFGADEEEGRPYIVMELMPGTTLANLVEKNGPLKPRDAVGRILDVIDGLQEAHRCGLIHRDVKPSNCFIDADGRVKVGDFGLSKALKSTGNLTQSGTFLGTLLYAAPEQIRNDHVDQQADVYSVAATLYFLLTGRAPFQTDDNADTDAAAALARTLTDPATPIRKRRREVPTTLDAVVLRGLERSRERRWPNLEAFRQALLPFVRDQRSWALFGWRIGAYLVDMVALFIINLLLQIGVGLLYAQQAPGTIATLVMSVVIGSVPVLYFFAPEWLFGASPGKLLCGLRIRTSLRNDRPGALRIQVRTVLWFVLYNAPSWVLFGVGYGAFYTLADSAEERRILLALLAVFASPLTLLAGLLLLGCTQRPSNGFRALHDFLSGTMVIRLPAMRMARLLAGYVAPPQLTPMPGTVPARLGAFAVRGLLCEVGDDQLLLAEDGGLNRGVWLWARPRGAEDLSGVRRDLSRTTRPRWLATGREGGRRWDAFVAAPGCLLADVRRGGRFEWAEMLPVLEALAAELTAACADNTLPRRLSLEQVWIDAAGRVQLLDLPLRFPVMVHEHPDPQRRALDLLRQVAGYTLEGNSRSPHETGPIRAPLPDRAAAVLRRLMAAPGSAPERDFSTIRAAQNSLRAARDTPAEVTRRRRAIHLLTLVPLVVSVLIWLLTASYSLTAVALMSNWKAEAHAEEAVKLLHDGSDQEIVALSVIPDPLLAAGAGARNAADFASHQRLKDKRAQLRQRREFLLASHLGLTQRVLEDGTAGSVSSSSYSVPAEDRRARLRHLETLVDDEEIERTELRKLWWWLVLFPLLFGSLLWPLWTGLTHGGVGQLIAGIRLVQADGRPAARWRCALRSLLACWPIAVLLALSLVPEGWRLAGEVQESSWAWLAWASWWLAWTLVVAFMALALRWPNRGWHDWLAGTYLVPRGW